MITNPVDTETIDCAVSNSAYVHRALLLNEADRDTNSAYLTNGFTNELDDYLIVADVGYSTKYLSIGWAIHIELNADYNAYTVTV